MCIIIILVEVSTVGVVLWDFCGLAGCQTASPLLFLSATCCTNFNPLSLLPTAGLLLSPSFMQVPQYCVGSLACPDSSQAPTHS